MNKRMTRRYTHKQNTHTHTHNTHTHTRIHAYRGYAHQVEQWA